MKKNETFYRADFLPLSLNGISFAATSLCFDTQNNLWVCDNRALYCYRFAAGSHAASPLYLDGDLSGTLLLYTDDKANLQVLSHPLADNYLRSYKVESLLKETNTTSPQIRLTAVRLFKQDFDWNKRGFVTNTLGVPQPLRLKHNQNLLRFYFSGLTGDYSHSTVYRYRLVGYDKDWSLLTARGKAEYTELPAGRFTFEVQARNAGGEWSPSTVYAFLIEVGWYESWWAFCLWILLGLNLFIAALHYHGQIAERKARMKQLLVEEQLKSLRAQINPHFLQNTFAFLAHELYALHNTKAIKALDQLSTYLRNVLRFSDKTAITLEEELVFAEAYLQMQQQLLSVRFWYSINVADEVDVFDVQVPSMLLQPLLQNALKYGVNGAVQNSIVLTIEADKHYIKCVINDSGSKSSDTAFSLRKAGSGKGLPLTEERMNLFTAGKSVCPNFCATAMPEEEQTLPYSCR